MWLKVLNASTGALVGQVPMDAVVALTASEYGLTGGTWAVLATTAQNLYISNAGGNTNVYAVALGLPDETTAWAHIADLVGSIST